jgi:hypothetical protein
VTCLDRERRLDVRPTEKPDREVEILAQVAQREERRLVAVLDDPAASRLEHRRCPLEDPEDVIGSETGPFPRPSSRAPV